MKLPFVWELNNDGIISHAIGTIHKPIGHLYKEDIQKYVKGKKYGLFELTKEACDIINQKQNELLEMVNEGKIEETYNIIETSNKISHIWGLEIDDIIENECNKQKIKKHSMDDPELIKYHKIYLKLKQPPGTNLQTAYLEKDEETIKKIIEAYQQNINELTEEEKDYTIRRDQKIFQRSMEYLNEPCIIAAGFSHLMTNPSILELYKEKGIQVKRI